MGAGPFCSLQAASAGLRWPFSQACAWHHPDFDSKPATGSVAHRGGRGGGCPRALRVTAGDSEAGMDGPPT